MKILKLLLAVVIVIITTTAFSQSKYKEINFRVEGNCGMCETRIENALDLKGIKLADWDVKTKNCRVVYKTAKIKEEEIHQIIADKGHSTDKIKASKEAYDSLHGCCKY